VRLYCLPHAGGSANVFLPWRRLLDATIELQPVELSGRGRRITSQLYGRFDEVLADIVRQVTQTPVPEGYALFGHSFGALLAYELAHELLARGHPAPSHLFVSASCAPERVGEIEIALPDGDRELLTALAYLGGTPHGILEDEEAVQLFAPILRADLHALFDYRSERTEPLDCDISVVLALADSVASGVDAELWGRRTAGRTTTQVIDGGHFAALEQPAKVVPLVNEALRAAASRDAA
jgi:surfactin synthase thioesterase subunit